MQLPTEKFSNPIFIALLLGALAAFGVKNSAAEEPAKEPAKTPPKIEIELDTSDAPEMADWAEKAKKACEDFYPTIVEFLDSPGFEPPKKTKIVFKKMNGVAFTAGGTITCSAKWFTDHPDDVGAVIHELCHVVQGYRKKQPPGWVTEGIADYVRWFNFEPKEKHPRIRQSRKGEIHRQLPNHGRLLRLDRREQRSRNSSPS